MQCKFCQWISSYVTWRVGMKEWPFLLWQWWWLMYGLWKTWTFAAVGHCISLPFWFYSSNLSNDLNTTPNSLYLFFSCLKYFVSFSVLNHDQYILKYIRCMLKLSKPNVNILIFITHNPKIDQECVKTYLLI